MSHSSGVIFDQIEARGKRMTTAQEVEQDLVQESWNVGSPTHRELIERTKKQRCYLAAILRQTTEGTDALVESHYADDGSGFIGDFVPAEVCRNYERLWKESGAQIEKLLDTDLLCKAGVQQENRIMELEAEVKKMNSNR
jgi:hypothetical protein